MAVEILSTDSVLETQTSGEGAIVPPTIEAPAGLSEPEEGVTERDLVEYFSYKGPDDPPTDSEIERLIDEYHLMDQNTGPRTTPERLGNFLTLCREMGLIEPELSPEPPTRKRSLRSKLPF